LNDILYNRFANDLINRSKRSYTKERGLAIYHYERKDAQARSIIQSLDLNLNLYHLYSSNSCPNPELGIDSHLGQSIGPQRGGGAANYFLHSTRSG
jgi:hypothetical protein